MIVEDWKKIPVPLGVVAAALFGAWWLVVHADDRYVLSMNYAQDRYYEQRTSAEREERTLNRELIKLEVKCETLRKCDEAEKALKKETETQIQKIRLDLKELDKRNPK